MRAYVVDWPWVIVRVVGFEESEKSGVATCAAFTVSDTPTVFVRPPPVPLTVMLVVPVAAPAVVEIVSVEAPVVGFGLNEALTPLGSALVENETLLLKPPVGATVRAYVVDWPWVIVRVVGFDESEKSGVGAGPPEPRSAPDQTISP